MATKLDHVFYFRPATVVAPDLLGKILVYQSGSTRLSARIVETEAYLGALDPASHAYRGKTARNSSMFGPAGQIYVYFTYGMHFCMNVVTGDDGIAEAVLLRAAEPLEGIATMEQNRKTQILANLCSGPAKLVQAFGLDRKINGQNLYGSTIWVEDDGIRPQIVTSSRVGISQAKDLPLRHYVKDNLFVSKPNKNRYNLRYG